MRKIDDNFILGALMYLFAEIFKALVLVGRSLRLKFITFVCILTILSIGLLVAQLYVGSMSALYNDVYVFSFVSFSCLIMILSDEYGRLKDNVCFFRYEKSMLFLVLAVVIFLCRLKFENEELLFCCFGLSLTLFFLYTMSVSKEREILFSENPPDSLYRSRIYNKAHISIRELVCNNRGSGITVGLCGEWGTGKSFLIKKLRFLLSQPYDHKDKRENRSVWCDSFVVCENVELWEVASLEDAWNRIFIALSTAITGKPPVFQSRLWRIFIHLAAIFLPNGKSIREIHDIIVPEFSSRSTESIDSCLGVKKVVLFVDDLERANYTVIQAILPLFERLKRIKNLVVICSIAEKELLENMKRNGLHEELAYGYLNKLFDLRIEMPLLSPPSIKNYLQMYFRDKYADCRLVESFFRKYFINFDNPRQIDRVLEKLSYIERCYYSRFRYRFGDVSVDERALVEVRYVFIVEMLRIVSPKVIDEIDMSFGIREIFRTLPASYFLKGEEVLITLSMQQKADDDREKINVWATEHPIMHLEFQRKGAASRLLHYLYKDYQTHHDAGYHVYMTSYKFAVSQTYARVKVLHENEIENIIYKNVDGKNSFQKQIEDYFLESNEIFEPESMLDAIYGVIDYIFEKLCKAEESFLLNNNKNYLEYLNRTLSYELELKRNNGKKSQLSGFSDFLFKSLNYNSNKENEVDENLFKLLKDSLVRIYSLIPFDEQGGILNRLNQSINSRSKCEVNNDKCLHIHKALQLVVFKDFVKEICKIYADGLCYCINKQKEGKIEQRYLYALYEIFHQEYLNCFKEGVDLFIRNAVNHLNGFYISWVKFIRKKYCDFDFSTDCDYCFISVDVYKMLLFIKETIVKNKNVYIELSSTERQEALRECELSINELSSELNFWNGSAYPDKDCFVKGISLVIEMLHSEMSKLKGDSYGRQ